MKRKREGNQIILVNIRK